MMEEQNHETCREQNMADANHTLSDAIKCESIKCFYQGTIVNKTNFSKYDQWNVVHRKFI